MNYITLHYTVAFLQTNVPNFIQPPQNWVNNYLTWAK